MGATPLRAVRVDEDTWARAMARAELEHRALSDVVRVALRAYAAGRYDAVEPKQRPKGGK